MSPQLTALLASLDADQAHVAAWTPADGNLRVVAAAGSGKTRSVVAMAARLASEGIVAPDRLIVTTFSRKAADEINERLAAVAPANVVAGMRVGTFHALALRAIRTVDASAFQGSCWSPVQWGMGFCLDLPGAKRNPGIPGPLGLWTAAVKFGTMPGTGEASLKMKADPKEYARTCDLLRANGYDEPAQVPREERPALADFGVAWQMVIDSKRSLGAWDFSDALAAWRDGMKAGIIQSSADVVIVDEAQDNSRVQLEVVRLLTGATGRTVLVGDLRQCIHVWRGAFPELFAKADTAIKAGTRQILTNYRSTPAIVALGNATAAGRAWALGDAAAAHRTDGGGVTVWGGFADDEAEAGHVADRIAADVAAGEKLADYAILCRTNAGVGMFQAMLTEARVPCAVVGGTSIFAHREIENFLCYLIVSERDAYNALGKMVNIPTRYIGAQFVTRVQATATQQGIGLLDAILHVAPTLTPGSQRGAHDLHATLTRLRRLAWSDKIDAVLSLLAGSDRAERQAASTEEEGSVDEDKPALYRCAASIARRFTNATDLYNFAEKCNNNVQFVTEGEGSAEGRVTLSTIHRSKGREWPRVFVAASEGVLPHHRNMSGDGEEDERRLFYVAATRARDSLVLLWNEQVRGSRSGAGGVSGPSPYLDLVDRSLWLTPQSDVTSAIAPVMEAVAVVLPAPVATALVVAASAVRTWAEMVAFAEARTAQEPRGEAGDGGRSVDVTTADMAELLEPTGFAAGTNAGQRTWDSEKTPGGLFWRVYSSIPEGGSYAAGVGEDSIRIASLWRRGDVIKPVLPREGYACRTRGWRVTLIKRIEAAAATACAIPACKACGAPTRERNSARGPFRGCIAYPECKGTAPM